MEEEEVTKIYNGCDVNINLHSGLDAGHAIGSSDYINPRSFEVPACGGFQLVDRAEGLERHFEPDREIVFFEDRNDLLEKAHHFLRRPQQRLDIAAAAQLRVLAEHTYMHRMSVVLDTCLGQASPVPTTADHEMEEYHDDSGII